MRDLTRNLAVMVRSSWRADRGRSIGALVTTVLMPVTQPLRAVGLGVVADGVASHDLRWAVTGALVVAVLTGAGRLLRWASTTIKMRLREHTIQFLDEEVIELSARAPTMELHERPEHQDEMELLRTDRHFLVNPFMPIAWGLAAVVQLGTTIVVFLGLHPALALLPLAGVPALLLSLQSERWWERARKLSAQDYRLGFHLMELATLPDAGKEVRIFDLGDELTERYRRVMRRIERRHAAVDLRRVVTQSAGWAVFALAYMGAVVFVTDRVLQGSLSVGAVVLTLSLGAQINGQLAELAETASWFSRTAQAAGRYRWLMEETARQEAATRSARVPGTAVPGALRDGIRFEGVDFAYPGTRDLILRDIDLHLPAGATVAVVGENGAGKTTLVKLLLRLYEPTGGRITVDGVDLAAIDLHEWRAATTAAFQDFARFQFLARHSIGLSAPAAPDTADTAATGERVLAEAVERAAARDLHDALPDGFATMLGREFAEGIELSIGQWQKVAVARAMVRLVDGEAASGAETGEPPAGGHRPPLLLVLDEPTASLDAPTEHELFDHFTGVARSVGRQTGTITVLVSHRFSTVRAADMVVVVADNRVAEVGSHDELLGRGGRYAELYNLQAASYR